MAMVRKYRRLSEWGLNAPVRKNQLSLGKRRADKSTIRVLSLLITVLLFPIHVLAQNRTLPSPVPICNLQFPTPNFPRPSVPQPFDAQGIVVLEVGVEGAHQFSDPDELALVEVL